MEAVGMEKVVFVDCGIRETEVRTLNLRGDGFVKDARFIHPRRTFTGDYERQVHEIAIMIADINPDTVVVDSAGMGAGLGDVLCDMLEEMGIREKRIEETPAYKPPKDFMMGRM